MQDIEADSRGAPVSQESVKDIQQNKPIKQKRKYEMTPARESAFKKMQEARKLKIEEKRNRIIKSANKKSEPISFTSEPKEEIIATPVNNNFATEQPEASSSTGTDSSNYESDENSKPVIVSNYDDNEPESKIKITKVKRKNNIKKEELKKIYEDIKSNENIEKTSSQQRKKELDKYFKDNKEKFVDSGDDEDLPEIELSQEESEKLQKRFLRYKKLVDGYKKKRSNY